ncbi:hypothetical protein N8I77_002168 [Diaporthe amygdali]|uniref:C2H2-type domain-containing protein n=1 Tax=Phomopsis amygdali TaxID=1214568 RepID=A0AAD9STK5_PHOAM|nr:hypothetical protein N8I77_002168 [Diaporthe amygdali]
MEFPYFTYDAPYQCFPHDHQEYTGQTFTDEFDTTGQDIVLNFPVHDASVESLYPYGHSSMQRFLKDTQRASLFNPMPQSRLPGVAQPVNPIPPTAPHGRQGSPFSSNEPSSCSSAQSPHADTEHYTDNTPSTPSEGMFFTPYASARETECQFPLFGIGEASSETRQFMTMGDCNTNEDSKTEWEDSGHAIDFESPQQSFTCDSRATESADIGSVATRPSVAVGYHRLNSPEDAPTVVKDEILIPEQVVLVEKTTSAYPSPSVGASEDELEEIDVVPPQSEDDDDDDDYHPDKKSLASATPRTNKLKRGAAKKALEKAAPKRARTTSSGPSLKILPPPSTRNQGCFPCPECSHSFKDECTLQSHVKKQHTRPFICVFRFAGCDSTFASKNEWKRHVMSQHLLLYYWLCDIDVCAHNKNDPTAPHSHSSKRSKSRRADNAAGSEPIGPPLPDGAIFNRKDLYTQHLRRMHTPSHIKKTGSAKSSKKASATAQASSCTTAADWDDHIKILQCQALRERCQLPDYMQCPASRCSQTFTGADAWDQRMEHVAKHLEKAATGAEDKVVFGGPTDPSLMAWVSRPDVAVARQLESTGAWVLNNPLRAAGESRATGRKRSVPSATSSPVVNVASPAVTSVASEIHVEDEDEDAEGEEE